MEFQCYIDMDSCLTDFNKAVQALGEGPALGLPKDAPEEAIVAMFQAIERAGEGFWSKMSWMFDGKDLWKMFLPFRPTILTSTGSEGPIHRLTYAEAGKLKWVQDNIPGTPVFFSENKSEFVNPYVTCILVDDNKNNISAWDAAGGTGILHVSAENTERQFLELLWNQDKLDPSEIYW